MLDRVKADRATRDGLSDAGQHVLGAEYLQQPQHLDELAFAAFGHARFDQAPQRGEFFGQVPADQRRCLVESANLLFEQRQVMQRVEHEVLALIGARGLRVRSEEHTSELQSHSDLVCRLLLEKKKKKEK